mmetsp:Transcript_35204/g.104590  ORF Transcript_35204/g.104590 Transcript_35204/m.104590 type:complete len:380 (+) Transcript_35204:620-1759(+)
MLAHGVAASEEAHTDRRRPVRFDELLEGRQHDVRDGVLVEDLKNAAQAHEDLHLHFHDARRQQQLQHPGQDRVLDLSVLELLVQIGHLLENLIQNDWLLKLQAAQEERQQNCLCFRRRCQADEQVELFQEEYHNLDGDLLGAVQRLDGWPKLRLEVLRVRHPLLLDQGDELGDHDAVEAGEEQRVAHPREDPLAEDPLRAERRLRVLEELRKALQERHALRLVLLVELLEEPDSADIYIHEELRIDEGSDRVPVLRHGVEELQEHRVEVSRDSALPKHARRVASRRGAEEREAVARHQLVRQEAQTEHVRLEPALARHGAHLRRSVPRRGLVAQLPRLVVALESKGAVHQLPPLYAAHGVAQAAEEPLALGVDEDAVGR